MSQAFTPNQQTTVCQRDENITASVVSCLLYKVETPTSGNKIQRGTSKGRAASLRLVCQQTSPVNLASITWAALFIKVDGILSKIKTRHITTKKSVRFILTSTVNY